MDNQSKTDLSVIMSAMSFAADKHRNQRRKDQEASPYINHPIEVARLLHEVGGIADSTIIAAGILHDTVEDTDTTRECLEDLFGDEIASLVMECTYDKSLPQAERKQKQIEHAPLISARAKCIKLADKISNVRDMGKSPPASWSQQRCIEYVDWSKQVVAGLRGTNDALERLYDHSAQEALLKLTAAANLN